MTNATLREPRSIRILLNSWAVSNLPAFCYAFAKFCFVPTGINIAHSRMDIQQTELWESVTCSKFFVID